MSDVGPPQCRERLPERAFFAARAQRVDNAQLSTSARGSRAHLAGYAAGTTGPLLFNLHELTVDHVGASELDDTVLVCNPTGNLNGCAGVSF